MELSFYSLVPPIITLILAFWTRNIITSLLVGIVSAALMASGFSPLVAAKSIVLHIVHVTEVKNFLSFSQFMKSERLFIFAFLLFLSMVMAVTEHSGDAFAYAEFLRKKIKGSKSAQRGTLFFSLLLFIDDYLNLITTSSVMPVLTDTFRIPRIKLSYLVTSLAAPLCTLIPISAWGPPIAMFINGGGVDNNGSATTVIADSFHVLVKSIPFIFQSILMVLGAWFIVQFGISFGIIGRHEKIALKTGNVYGGRAVKEPNLNGHVNSHSLFNFVSPILVMFFTIIAFIIYTGDSQLVGGTNTLFETLASSNMYIALFFSGLVTLIFSAILHVLRGKVACNELCQIWWSGLREMGQSVIVLVLAWSFARFLIEDLGTGSYIAHLMIPVLSIKFLPAAVFVLGGITSFFMGSSWATMTIMFPLALPMALSLAGFSEPASPEALPIVFPLVGAIISGAMMGSSISPIADLLIISSNNTNTSHLDFIKAQMQYLLPLGFGSFVGFLVAGMTTSLGYAVSLGLSITSAFSVAAVFLLLINFVAGKSGAEDVNGV
ncbi:Na+/H+ antiporter NhaC family protein [Candidatus Dependentiae bacterium]